MVWINVGRTERCLLFLMLERDEPSGEPIFIRGVACAVFKIDYEPFTPKYKQRKMFCDERKILKAFDRLFKQKLARPLWTTRDGFSFTYRDRGTDFDFCVLTPKGRLVAERLKHQEQILQSEQAAVQRGLSWLRGLGWVYVTAEQVREVLWGDSFHGFTDRVAFDKYWNNTKLGIMLKKCTVKRVRVGMKDRRRKYRLI